MSEDYFGYFLTLCLGIYCSLRFRYLGDFAVKRNIITKYIPVLGHKWHILFVQILFLVTGIIMIVISSIKLLSVFF